MAPPDMIERLCRLPLDFRRGNKSIVDLAAEAGYFDNRGALVRSDLSLFLSRHQDLIPAWVQYSEDQRCSPAWYLLEREGSYIVGLDPDQELSFPSSVEAFAEFILRLLATFRGGILPKAGPVSHACGRHRATNRGSRGRPRGAPSTGRGASHPWSSGSWGVADPRRMGWLPRSAARRPAPRLRREGTRQGVDSAF